MSLGFDAQWAEHTVSQLRKRGVKFADGFGTADLDAIARSFGVAVPAELALFLRVGVPVSQGWARWVFGNGLYVRSESGLPLFFFAPTQPG